MSMDPTQHRQDPYGDDPRVYPDSSSSGWSIIGALAIVLAILAGLMLMSNNPPAGDQVARAPVTTNAPPMPANPAPPAARRPAPSENTGAAPMGENNQ